MGCVVLETRNHLALYNTQHYNEAQTFRHLVVSIMSYGSETWPVNAEMTRLINSFETRAYRIMTGVKSLDKVRNNVVLDSVSRNDLIHTFLSRQLRLPGHLLRSDHALYALYDPTHGKTRRGRPLRLYA